MTCRESQCCGPILACD